MNERPAPEGEAWAARESQRVQDSAKFLCSRFCTAALILLQEGDKVLLPEYGGTQVKLQEKE